MSNREQVKQLADTMPEAELAYVVGYMQRLCEALEIPNAETLAAFAELDNGGGKVYTGSTEDMIADILAGED